MTEVLTAPGPPSDSACLSSSVLRRTHTPAPPYVLDTSSYAESDYSCSSYSKDSHLDAESDSSSVTSSPRPDKSPLNSSPPSSISLDPRDDYDEEDLFFPSYGDPTIIIKVPNTSHSAVSPDDIQPSPPSQSPATPTYDNPTPDAIDYKPADDTAVHDEPSRQVDYLSHDWIEEDVCQSWRHIVANRRTYGERSRLENASWRTWAKAKYGLKTVSPEQLNWQKDCDVTWLYGPLQEARKWHRHTQSLGNGTPGYTPAGHSSNLSKSSSFGKRPILKKRSVSEVMLLKSLSSSSLVKQAAAVVQAQRGTRRESDEQRRIQIADSSKLARAYSISMYSEFASLTTSEQSSGLQSPEAGGRRHIRFDDKVEQCIAVEFIPGSSSDETSAVWTRDRSPDSSDDDLVMMRTKAKRHSSGPSSRRNSIGQESKGIAKLPSTTLKYHHDEPYCPGHPDQTASPLQRPRLQASSSQETLRPSHPSTNFLLDDDEDGLSWEPSGAFDTPRPGSASSIDDKRAVGGIQESADAPDGLRRTASGMFMPFEDEEQNFPSSGVLGRVVDTVNTARDIFSVIMNVGWRS